MSDQAYAAREQANSPDITRYIEKQVLLQTLDHLWREHLVVLDHLRQVIGWRGMAQRDPLNEYKSEAFELFDALITRLREAVTAQLMRVEVAHERPADPQLPPMQASHVDPLTGEDELALAQINARIASGDFTPRALGSDEASAARDPNDPGTWGRIGRNEPCPCGSGKKFKHCHGVLA
jgi:preprotein translocase subunit SecA